MNFNDFFNEDDDYFNSTCWYDTFMDNQSNIASQNSSDNINNTCVASLDDGLTSFENNSTPLDDHLNWNDLTFDSISPTNTDIPAYQISSDDDDIININIFDHLVANDNCMQNNDVMITSPQERNIKLASKRYAPYNKVRWTSKDDHHFNPVTNSVAKSLEPFKKDQLLILSNGEIYQKVSFPRSELKIANVGDLLDISISENNHYIQPKSPSSSSDSGLSLTSLGSPSTDPHFIHQPTSCAKTNQAYTLSEALFADPPLREGVLTLTDEEKNCLIAHDYPIPDSLPLDKEQEKYLKKIRRKIKNKVAAQESRRRRKEYTDNLESRVKQQQDEKQELIERLSNLESYNKNLLDQIRTLTGRVRLTHPTKGGACFMVLVFFFAVFIGSWDSKSWSIGYAGLHPSTHPQPNFNPILGPNLPKLHRMLEGGKQKVLSHGPNIEHPLIENYFNVKDVEENQSEDGQDDLQMNLVSKETGVSKVVCMSPWHHWTSTTTQQHKTANLYKNNMTSDVCIIY